MQIEVPRFNIYPYTNEDVVISNKIFGLLCVVFMLAMAGLQAESRQILRENIVKAKPGDYIVTNQGKNYTVLLIREKVPHELIIEEITVPSCRFPGDEYNRWKNWIEEGAPGHTGWFMYQLNTDTGAMKQAFSFPKNSWFEIAAADNFLSGLLNLNFQYIPPQSRKHVGPRNTSGSIVREQRRIWQPQMIVEGQIIPDVQFSAWKTYWPKDGSDLAGKLIEIYIPEDDERYPSYFPYWLQISGIVGKAKIRIVDSGTGLKSPKPNVFLLDR